MIGVCIAGFFFGLYMIYLEQNYHIYKISDNFCLDYTVSAKSLEPPKLGAENTSISSKLRTFSGVITLSDDGTHIKEID